MENLRRLARVYYEIASADERAAEQKYFDKLCKNGKGEIRFDEYKNSVSNWLSHKSVFDLLNSKHDGILSRGDATALYYIDKKMSLPVCQDCKCLILYMYITCTTCLNKHARRFDLCGNCFEKRTIRHEHPWKDFSDQFSLLEKWKKGEMDKLREIAKVHYKIGSEEVRDLADKFFKSIGPDKDKFVDFAKFSAFMRREGYLHREYFSRVWNALTSLEILSMYASPFCQLVSTTGSSSNQRGRIDANRQVTTPSTADTRIVLCSREWGSICTMQFRWASELLVFSQTCSAQFCETRYSCLLLYHLKDVNACVCE